MNKFAFASNFVEAVESRRMFANILITGTPGDDTISVSSNPVFVTVNMNGVNTNYSAVRSITISGGTGNDSITIQDSLGIGAAISGNSGNDTIMGGGGNDTITGNNGSDFISGGEGNDYIFGNDGVDYLDGG